MTIDIIIIALSILVGLISLRLIGDSNWGWYLRLQFFFDAKLSLKDLRQHRKNELPLKQLIKIYRLLRSNLIIVSLNDIIDNYDLGVDLTNVEFGLIDAKSKGLLLSFKSACIADMQGIDICIGIPAQTLPPIPMIVCH